MAEKEANKAGQKKGVRSFIGGAIFTDERVTRQIPFILFLAFLGLLLIANRFRSEKVIRRIEVVEQSIKELRSESVTNSVKLMDVSRPSEVVERVKEAGLGLEEPQRPPLQLVVKNKKGKWK
ncbi:hypothetical protein MNBD_BACTEROID01-491 [hydrothermal vent metagenome]|uniref:Cell division protein FtsL n=1 Tax=hydrothermal vent metagenome TaxID=652676 RepID=A0A3B0U3B2_9ZZZZ